jgi:protein-tyrosine phosphatase
MAEDPESPSAGPGLDARVPPLVGGRNFRDLGGYPGAGGRSVRWRKVYRSGALSALTPTDFDYLDDLGIAVVCDLRSLEERRVEPTAWRGDAGPRIWARDYEMRSTRLARAALGESTAASLREHMLQSYRDLPYDHAESFRQVFFELLEGHLPLVIHCAGGKDRTGVAVALLLLALGVPRDVVMEDYELTNRLLKLERMLAPSPDAAGFAMIRRLTPEQRAPLMRADADYLESALDAIDSNDGSLGAYLDKRLGVTPSSVDRLQRALLEAEPTA